MKKIHFDHPHRQAHFDFFNQMNHPHFNLVANIEITAFVKQVQQYDLPFTYTTVFGISKVANSIKEFRWRIRGSEVIEHKVIHPSFTVFTEVADVFSFCEVKFLSDYPLFIKNAAQKAAAMRENPSISDEEGRDDYLFLSAIPWVSFTGYQHAMHYHPTDSVPRISWGKYFEQNGKILMPVAVQVHHALVDGRHVGQYFQRLEAFFMEYDFKP